MFRRLLLLLLLCSCTALGQQLGHSHFFGLPFVNLNDLAAGLGSDATRIGSSAVVRSGFGILTVWVGETDYLWLAAGSSETVEGRLSAPVLEEADGLWVPLELIDALGGTVSGVVVVMPDRSRLVLTEAVTQQPAVAGLPVQHGEVIAVGNGLNALRMSGGGQSVLLVDLGLLALAQPERRAELDLFNAGLEGYRPLWFAISASGPVVPDLEFAVSQPGVAARLTPPFGIVILQGDPELVAPGNPLSGVLLLPEATNLRESLRVEWQQMNSEIVFRK